MVLYLFLITVIWRHRFEDSVPVTKKQIICFYVGMVLLYIVKGSPVDLLGHILFSVHMAQMAVLLISLAPFLLWGFQIGCGKKFLKLK